jgi:3-oxoacyl-[acyl-carrier-protein] synthase I
MLLPPLDIHATSAVTAAGRGRAALGAALRAGRSALQPNRISSKPITTMVGEVQGLDVVTLPPAWQPMDCRNHRLAWLGLQADGFTPAVQALIAQHGAHRVGVVMGTSTSSIGASEKAYRDRDVQGLVPASARVPALHSLHSLGAFVQQALGTQGPSMTVSTACSSSLKALAVAQRWLALGLVDAVVVGGVDSLCDSVLFGFNALQLVARDACQPFDAQRRGISLGEAAVFALVTRSASPNEAEAFTWPRLLSVGESSDAHHMSAPQPDGASIEAALRQALQLARLAPQQIDCIHLHGTATVMNDAVEAAMVARVFGGDTSLPMPHAASTKGITGHTLGTSGLLGLVVMLLAMEQGFKPGTTNTQALDEACRGVVQRDASTAPVRHALINAFGFGGTNAVAVVAARARANSP